MEIQESLNESSSSHVMKPGDLVTLSDRNAMTWQPARVRSGSIGVIITIDSGDDGMLQIECPDRRRDVARLEGIDVLATPPHRLTALASRLGKHGVRLVAEKVETQEMARMAAKAGYDLFQGYFFARPTTLSTHAVTPRRTAYLDLLAAINDPEITIGELEQLVKRDASLSHRVLRCLQSASWGLRHEVSSIKEALILLGIEPVRKWTSIWAVAGLNGGRPSEVVTMALVRARMCEHIAGQHWGPQAASEHFLLGLCSLLDVMLQTTIAVATSDLPLPTSIRDALKGAPGRARSVLDCVLAYEQGDWIRADTAAQMAGIATRSIPDAYGDALQWVSAVTAMSGRG